MPEQQPSIGRIVHYVSHGTPVQADGSQAYTRECRAAIITELTGTPDNPDQVGLAVLNPTGAFFHRTVPFDTPAETAGAADCPKSDTHGNPFRYCGCGWVEAHSVAGTWHWPERV